MPTYEYVCKKCEHEFELFQSITSSPIRKCPHCGKLGVKRLIGTGSGIIFKGSGFYETDYKRAGSAGAKEKTDSGGDKPSEDASKKPSSGADKSESSKSTDRPKGDKS